MYQDTLIFRRGMYQRLTTPPKAMKNAEVIVWIRAQIAKGFFFVACGFDTLELDIN
jgi:hypothetical protein